MDIMLDIKTNQSVLSKEWMHKAQNCGNNPNIFWNIKLRFIWKIWGKKCVLIISNIGIIIIILTYYYRKPIMQSVWLSCRTVQSDSEWEVGNAVNSLLGRDDLKYHNRGGQSSLVNIFSLSVCIWSTCMTPVTRSILCSQSFKFLTLSKLEFMFKSYWLILFEQRENILV